MSTLLEKIKQKRDSIMSQLEGLKLTDELDNLDAVASERVMLWEKIEALDNAEAQERKRLENEVTALRKRERNKQLALIAKKVNGASKQHRVLTEKANSLILELVKTLIDRENAISREATGIGGEYEAIEFEDMRELRKELDFIYEPVKLEEHSFKKAWWHALYSCGDKGDLIRLAVAGVGSDISEPLREVNLSGLQEAVKAVADR